MVIQIPKITVRESILYFSLALYLVAALVNITFFVQIIPYLVRQFLLVLSLIFAMIGEVLFNKIDRHSILGIIIILYLNIAVFYSIGKISEIIVGIVLIFCLREIDIRSIIRFCFLFVFPSLIITILCSRLGIVTNYIDVDNLRIREYMGYRYALYPSTILMNSIAMFTYLKGKKRKIIELITLFGLAIFIFQKTNSRLAFFSSIILLSISLFSKSDFIFLKKYKFILFPLVFIHPILTIGSYWYTIQYNRFDNFDWYLNNFLGGRLFLTQKSLELYGYKLFSQKITWVGNGLNSDGLKTVGEYLYVDNLYIHLLQKFGLITLIIFLCLMVLVMFKLYLNNQILLILIMTVFAFHGVIDDLTFQLHYNSFLFIIGILMNKNYKFNQVYS